MVKFLNPLVGEHQPKEQEVQFLYLNHIHIQIGVVDGYTKFLEMFII
jgi:hypothetical protein